MKYSRLLTAALAGAAVAASFCTVAPATARPASTVSEPVRTAIRNLPVAAHSHASTYDRSVDFGDWIDQGGGCDTRAVVLKDESLAPTTQTSSCTVRTGRWYSFYNNRYYTTAYGGIVQIDHVVPVENAWISGAWRWTHATRVRYYNDLGDPRTLVAVDRTDNEAKGDKDPTAWLPAYGRCRYVRYWVAVKLRWRLTVTAAEKAKLAGLATACPNTTITVRRAVVTLG